VPVPTDPRSGPPAATTLSPQATAGTPSPPARSTTTRSPGRTTTSVARYASVAGVGDSIMLGASAALTAAVAATTGAALTVDARVGRQFAEGVTVVTGLVQAAALGDAVIVHLGTNGPVTVPLVRSLLDQLVGVRTVLLVNVRVPREWESGVNATLAAVGGAYPNVHLVDWHAATEGHPELLSADGVHPVAAGSAAYAELLSRALASA